MEEEVANGVYPECREFLNECFLNRRKGSDGSLIGCHTSNRAFFCLIVKAERSICLAY